MTGNRLSLILGELTGYSWGVIHTLWKVALKIVLIREPEGKKEKEDRVTGFFETI